MALKEPNNIERVLAALLTPAILDGAIARANVPDVYVERITRVEAKGNTARVYVVLKRKGYYKDANLERRSRVFYLGATDLQEIVIS